VRRRLQGAYLLEGVYVMKRIVSVLFEKEGIVQRFDAGNFVLKPGDRVIVQTDQGLDVGKVCEIPIGLKFRDNGISLKKVFRVATREDLKKQEEKRNLEREVYLYCYERVKFRDLPMNLVTVKALFDDNKVIVFFTAEGRVDFRELVKDLVHRFRTRIEMRQIGVRHQAKMIGALGACGRRLCCNSFLSSFAPVSIKMAKGQNLALNPSKISGMCGRLMCCLTYEYDYYEEVQRDIPRLGKRIKTIKGEGKILRHNALLETITIMLDSGEEIEVSYDDILKEDTSSSEDKKEKGNGE